MPHTLPVFFDPRMVAPNAASYSPSAAKPAQAVADWQARGLAIALPEFQPASREQLALAHDRAYVDGVLSLECWRRPKNDPPTAIVPIQI